MNKRAEGSIATYLTKGMVVAIALIVLYVILGGIFVSAGGVGAVFNISKIIVGITGVLAKVPIWIWVGLAGIYLLKVMFGR